MPDIKENIDLFADIAAPPQPIQLAEDTAQQLKLAGQVQRSFLPSQLPDSDKLKWSAIFRPADFVSGDIYDATRLDEQHIGFYIADAVGHSVPAALLTMFLKQALVMRQTTGEDYRIFGPTDVMRNLNQKMLDQKLDGSLFATCCYCLLNTKTMQVTYARAGHPYPILIKKDASPVQLQNRGGLLGVFQQTEYAQDTVQLEEGDKLFIYSDGCESHVGYCDDDGAFHFTDAFLNICDLPVEEMTGEFEQMVIANPTPDDILDDVTVLALEILNT